MDPSVMASTGAAVSIIVSAIGASYAIARCAPALASVTSEKPELGSKLLSPLYWEKPWQSMACLLLL